MGHLGKGLPACAIEQTDATCRAKVVAIKTHAKDPMKLPFARASTAAAAATGLALALLISPAGWAQGPAPISVAPPSLPNYAQPSVPGDGYIWAPGYWSWNATANSYFWVPGTWVLPPVTGDLWTPGYWAFENAGYLWHGGYWGSRVGFYGGLNYGHGYEGSGYQGGRWDHGVFNYNRAVTNVNTRIVRNVYNARVIHAGGAAGVSFNGGRLGTGARTTEADRRLRSAAHSGPSDEQMQHERTAMTMPMQKASPSPDFPRIAATPRASAFDRPDVERIQNDHVSRSMPPDLQRQREQRSPQQEPARPQRQEPEGHAEQPRQEGSHQGR